MIFRLAIDSFHDAHLDLVTGLGLVVLPAPGSDVVFERESLHAGCLDRARRAARQARVDPESGWSSASTVRRRHHRRTAGGRGTWRVADPGRRPRGADLIARRRRRSLRTSGGQRNGRGNRNARPDRLTMPAEIEAVCARCSSRRGVEPPWRKRVRSRVRKGNPISAVDADRGGGRHVDPPGRVGAGEQHPDPVAPVEHPVLAVEVQRGELLARRRAADGLRG